MINLEIYIYIYLLCSFVGDQNIPVTTRSKNGRLCSLWKVLWERTSSEWGAIGRTSNFVYKWSMWLSLRSMGKLVYKMKEKILRSYFFNFAYFKILWISLLCIYWAFQIFKALLSTRGGGIFWNLLALQSYRNSYSGNSLVIRKC